MDYVILLGAFAPVLILMNYIYKKDVHKEPYFELGKVFFISFVATVPVGIIELILGFFIPTEVETTGAGVGLFVNTFIGIAVIEEVCKWLSVRFANYNNKHFDETYDAIVYATFSALGFAACENLSYVYSCMNQGVALGFLTIIMRFITSVPGHCFFGVLMGYYFAKAKAAQVRGDNKAERKNLIFSILSPALAHAIFDYLLIVGTNNAFLIWILFVIVFYIISIKLIKNASKNNVLYGQVANTNDKI